MKHKILITALIAIGFSLSGVIHAVPIAVTKPDGSKAVANVEGNKLMLRDATGKLWLPAGDGTYKTSDGKAIIVQGGIIAAQSGNAGAPAGNTGTGHAVGPMFTPPPVQSGNAAAPIASAPGGNAVGVEPNRDFNELWQRFVPAVSGSSFARQQTGEQLLRKNVPKSVADEKPGPQPGGFQKP